MTVSSIIPVNNYTGNGSVTKFDFDFLIDSESELVVTHTDLNGISNVLKFGIDYSINELGNENGSFIEFPLKDSSFDILSQGEILSLSLSLPIKQESEFASSSSLNLTILEKTFDYIVRILQILNRRIERSIKVEEGGSATPDSLIEQIRNAERNSAVYSKEANDVLQETKIYRNEVINSSVIAENCVQVVQEIRNEFEQGNMFKYQLFDVVQKDYELSFSEKQGLELLGSYVYKNALIGERYGYPNFYNKCLEEKLNATPVETILGDNTITLYVHPNGHQYYDISDKLVIDDFYETYGNAWFYGVDTDNERILLPQFDYVEVNAKSKVPVIGDGTALGLTNGTEEGGLYNWTPNNNATLCAATTALNSVVGTTNASGKISSAGSLGLTQKAESSGVVSKFSDFSSSKYYYMVVGNTCVEASYYDVVANGKELLAELNNGLASKANNDLSGTAVSQEFIDKSLSWIMPDYTNVTVITENNFIAPFDGWAFGSIYKSSTSVGSASINGYLVAEESSDYAFIHAPMKRGDVLTIEGTIRTLNFLKCRGAN